MDLEEEEASDAGEEVGDSAFAAPLLRGRMSVSAEAGYPVMPGSRTTPIIRRRPRRMIPVTMDRIPPTLKQLLTRLG